MNLDRRNFLKTAGLFSLSMVAPGLNGWAFASAKEVEQNRLVVIFLRGAVDGLNVVAPYGDKTYHQLRPSIALAGPQDQDGVIDLDGYFGMHPALNPLYGFWQDKSLAFVHSSGSPDASRSHFDAQDYMESGCPGVKSVSTGWMNRLLTELPDNKSPVRALNFGPTIPRIFAGNASVASAPLGRAATAKIALDRPVIADAFNKLYDGNDVLSKAFREGMEAHKTIDKELADEMESSSKGAPPPNQAFGSQVAKLLVKDPTVQVAFLAFGGFDTHVNQGAGKGQLANRLTPLAAGLKNLISDLGPTYKKTNIVIVSEFGRTARENGNAGTDHGHGNVMWLLGGNVRGGKVYGDWKGLSSSALNEGRDLAVTTDFRNVLIAVLHNHLEVSGQSLERVFPHFTKSGNAIEGLYA